MLAKRKSEPLQQYSRVVGINVAHGSFRSTSTQTTMGATFLNQQGGTPSLLSVGAEAPTNSRAGVPPCWRQSASGSFVSQKNAKKIQNWRHVQGFPSPFSKTSPVFPNRVPRLFFFFPNMGWQKVLLARGLQVILFRH